MEEIVLGSGAVFLGATLFRFATSLVQARSRNQVSRVHEHLADEGFRERVLDALAEAKPKESREPLAWNGFRKFFVARKTVEADGVRSFYLKPYDRRPVPLYVPGQHVTLQLTPPDRPQAMTRCYSLSDAPLRADGYRITVKRQEAPAGASDLPDGLVSGCLVDDIAPGATLAVRAPSGRFYFNTLEQRPAVFIAGGIGVTPIMSMLNAVAAFGQPREAFFFYGVRNRASHAFHREIWHAVRRHGNLHRLVCYSRPTKECMAGRDYDHRGRVTVDLLRATLPHKDFVFYLCGPAGMIADLSAGIAAWGVPKRDIRTEAFGAGTARLGSQSGAAQAVPSRIGFARSQKTLTWDPQHQVILELAERNGIGLASGCRAGQCGSCMTALVKGRVRHIVRPGLPLAPGHCLPCVAVPEGEVVLEA